MSKKTFDFSEALSKETFDFSEALRRMKEGRKVRRKTWDEGMYIHVDRKSVV